MRRLAAVSLLPLAFCLAQLPAPNAAGVANGHLHFKTRDLDASRKLWVDVLGGKPSKMGRMEAVTFPDLIILYEKGEPEGGTAGSVVDHVGLKVRDLKATLAKARANGLKVESEQAAQAFLAAPDGVRLELSEDPTLTVPTANHHIHFSTAAVPEMRAWYARVFGAVPGKRGRFEAADLPGVNLSFTPVETTPATTRGRALDHIGFEVRGLEAFVKKLEAEGIKFDMPYRKVPSLNLAIAFFTDPWGTYIELTEGLGR